MSTSCACLLHRLAAHFPECALSRPLSVAPVAQSQVPPTRSLVRAFPQKTPISQQRRGLTSRCGGVRLAGVEVVRLVAGGVGVPLLVLPGHPPGPSHWHDEVEGRRRQRLQWEARLRRKSGGLAARRRERPPTLKEGRAEARWPDERCEWARASTAKASSNLPCGRTS